MASVYGTNGIDTLEGTSDSDEIYGYPQGGSPMLDTGDDRLSGLAGDDYLFGGGGNDVLEGGTHADYLDGGAGLDTAVYENSAFGVTVNLSTGTASGGDADGDIFLSIDSLLGSGFRDTLTGNAGVNVISGLAGDDTIDGGAGADTLDGGVNGFLGDTVSYSASNGGVIVNLNVSTASGGHAQGDVIAGFENAIGSALNDTLTGSAGVNRLQGLEGDDTINGGAGADILDGGANGTAGDTLSYLGSASGVNVNLATNVVAGGNAAGDIIANFENVTGTLFDDILVGTALANTINGSYGDDFVGWRVG